MNMDGEKLRFIMGIKLKQFRLEKKLSLKQLSDKTHLSISYLSEIEKGKKYPKPEKIFQLAQALEVNFDDLVSLQFNKEMDTLSTVFTSPVIQEFPFRMYGVSPQDLLALITDDPHKAGALIRTFLEVGQAYDMRVEHLLLAALRSYQQMHQNYFEEIEEAAITFLSQTKLDKHFPLNGEVLKNYLIKNYGYEIDETSLSHYLELQEFRSVWIDKNPPRLLLNPKLSSPQKSFIYGREIGFNYLDLKERPKTSTRLKVESFDQLLNNFKASYFAGALLVQRQMLIDDLAKFFNNSRWNGEDFMLMINRHVVTPEMFLYRLSELLPRFFGLKEIAFFRFHSSAAPAKYNLTKMFNLSGVFLPMGIGSKEHHCRRWLPIQLLKSLAQNKDSEQKSLPQIAAQRSRFINLNEEFFTISLAHGSRLNKATNLSGAMCFRINQPFKDTVKFWDDPAIPIMDVNESCERCGLSQALCSDRAAPAAIHQQAQKIKTREKVLDQLIRDLG